MINSGTRYHPHILKSTHFIDTARGCELRFGTWTISNFQECSYMHIKHVLKMYKTCSYVHIK